MHECAVLILYKVCGIRTKMTFASGNVQGVKAGAVFGGKGFGGGEREELANDVEVSLFRGGEESGFAEVVDLVEDGGLDVVNLGVELEGPHHDGVNLGEELADGGEVPALSGEVELGVFVAAGDLLDILLVGGVKARGEFGEKECLAGGGEEEGGARGGGSGGSGGFGERGLRMVVLATTKMMIHDRPHQ